MVSASKARIKIHLSQMGRLKDFTSFFITPTILGRRSLLRVVHPQPNPHQDQRRIQVSDPCDDRNMIPTTSAKNKAIYHDPRCSKHRQLDVHQSDTGERSPSTGAESQNLPDPVQDLNPGEDDEETGIYEDFGSNTCQRAPTSSASAIKKTN
ncbi:hypothetical protein PsorP6_001097 [Peronosclerospora sorghi]|uniref:Uncharacterized protein n=1 Tax=Peronosclerospora sorghi TaxID=230839 RepID=A0ACC0WWQ6_9STRA|nr:hypothetical protein PsorP6_001097 [Peronosclerospora sorghi]